MRVLAIDPGVWVLGWAEARDGAVAAAGLSKVKPKSCSLGEAAVQHSCNMRMADRVYVESMEIRPADTLARSRDLMNVQSMGCLVAGMLGTPVLAPVSMWKGNVPKEIHHIRILAALSRAERQIVEEAAQAAGKTHAKEVLDATGLLLWGLRRIGKAGV